MEKWDAFMILILRKIDGKILIRGEEKYIPDGVLSFWYVTILVKQHTDGSYSVV